MNNYWIYNKCVQSDAISTDQFTFCIYAPKSIVISLITQDRINKSIQTVLILSQIRVQIHRTSIEILSIIYTCVHQCKHYMYYVYVLIHRTSMKLIRTHIYIYFFLLDSRQGPSELRYGRSSMCVALITVEVLVE